MPFKILVTDEIDPDGVAVLAGEPEMQIDEVPTLPPAELLRRIAEYDAIVGRSATRITAELLRRAERLKVVGRAGVGVDNIDIDTATELGVAVINAPAGNTIAVAELFFGSLIGLLRHIPRADAGLHADKWDRSKYMGDELRGRTLGIVGVGRIGSEVALRARAFEMDVVGFDPYVTDERFLSLRIRRAVTLEELLAEVDILTVHTPLTDETAGMIGRRELSRLKPGAIVANLARGGIVEESALAAALESGALRGATVDAFLKEPLAADHPFRALPNILLTPHIGASTREAQRNVAVDVCVAVRDALLHGEFGRSVNVAEVEGRRWSELQPAMLVARRSATIARQLLADQGVRAVQRLSLRCGPDVMGGSEALLAAAAMGLLEGVIESERLNLISARTLAAHRGIELSVAESAQLGHPTAVQVSLGGAMRELVVGGVAPPGIGARITQIGAFRVDVSPRQTLIILTNDDVPGVIGQVGTLLGHAHVNIAEYHQARLAAGGEALAAITVDGVPSGEVCKRLLEVPGVHTATVVSFRG
ncbi:MAG TPA: phosphoglycerate dehydrogenase [Gemmatimonadaceae bacterium]